MWRARSFLVLVLAVPLLSAESQVVVDTDSVADVRCFMVAMQIGKTPGTTQQTAALTGAMYYLGRLDGRSPKLDLESVMVAEEAKMTPADLRSEAVRCGATITARGNEIQRIGKDLIERGK
jgi:hypothetical protein